MLESTANFVEVWQAAATIAEVVEKTGVSDARARKWASMLRAKGVPLKKFPTNGKPTKRAPSLAVTHENEDHNWQSPDWIIEAAMGLMDEIDLDPASDEVANRRVLATRYFTEQDDGLKQSWGPLSRVFLNPPGRMVIEFWDKLIAEWDANRVWMAFWVGFNIEHLRWISTRQKHPLGFYTCIPLKRIKFERPGLKRNTPSCGNYLTWLPDEDCNENWQKFCDAMGPHGRCIRGTEGFYSGERYVKHPNAGISCRTRRIKGVPASDGDRTGAGS